MSQRNTPSTNSSNISENGLLSLEKTPYHLVDIVKRNRTESRLLRLPSEIRNAIWQYALGNQVDTLFFPCGTTEITGHDRTQVLTPRKSSRQAIVQILPTTSVSPDPLRDCNPAFAFNTFCFINLETLPPWSLKLMPAQLKIIASVELVVQ
ncbi:hypothetical protein K505DRAFT_368215 [Melanomma pulvis-pyrius CBS 109.77]|uniref:Uncharacterized protein n=1 Tax=Melanomma pulvis-pyrius CBS 109.77 TaxID=1314802 RepID=A0A6A6WRE7_9PLEO|nr:hypothetical protein K505DRAFT_368215 [Melanomma pulvis-pyrius CBS 109.77]